MESEDICKGEPGKTIHGRKMQKELEGTGTNSSASSSRGRARPGQVPSVPDAICVSGAVHLKRTDVTCVEHVRCRVFNDTKPCYLNILRAVPFFFFYFCSQSRITKPSGLLILNIC